MGFSRAGSRIGEAVERALTEAVCRNQIVQHGLFFCPTSQPNITIRDREDVQSSNLRKTDYLPPAEIREALAAVVRVHLGITPDEATTEVTRLFGFKSTSSNLKQIIQDEVKILLEQNTVNQKNGKLYFNEEATITEIF